MRNADKAQKRTLMLKLRHYQQKKGFNINHLLVIAASFLLVMCSFSIFLLIKGRKTPKPVSTPTAPSDNTPSTPTKPEDQKKPPIKPLHSDYWKRAKKQIQRYKFTSAIQILQQCLPGHTYPRYCKDSNTVVAESEDKLWQRRRNPGPKTKLSHARNLAAILCLSRWIRLCLP